jgi:magnesium transporter
MVPLGMSAQILSGFDEVTRARAGVLREEGCFFWLDVSTAETPPDEAYAALGLGESARLALADEPRSRDSHRVHADGESVVFAVRCYLEPEGGDDGRGLQPVAVHVAITGGYLLTLHRERVSLASRLDLGRPPDPDRDYLVSSVLDRMVASTFAALDEIEDGLEVAGSDDRGLPRAAVRETVATLTTMRRWLMAEQDVFERAGVEVAALPGFGADAQRLFDRLGEQVDRLLASVDAAANALAMLLDLQLNERAYLVSVLATIFVPLTLLTGYFGMNFGWLVGHIDSAAAFWALGLVLPIATGVLTWRLLVGPFLRGDRRDRRR